MSEERIERIAESILLHTPTHIRIRRPQLGGAGYIIPIDSIKTGQHGWQEEFEENECGETILIEFIYMSDEEYSALDEFTGW